MANGISVTLSRWHDATKLTDSSNCLLMQSRSQSPRVFWSAPRLRVLVLTRRVLTKRQVGSRNDIASDERNQSSSRVRYIVIVSLKPFIPFSTDLRSSQLSTGAQSFFGYMGNEADIEDGECAHVPGLRKKKWI